MPLSTPPPPPLSNWEALINLDLRIIHSIQRYMYDPANSKLKAYVDQVISSNPLNDINVLTWLSFFTIAALNIGNKRWFSFMWCSSLNLLVVCVLRIIFKSRRPFEIDRTLKPLTNKQRTNYGFPSIESHMAVVVYGFIAIRFAEWYLTPPLFILTLFVGFTRVYTCSRFVHQIIGSYVTGIIGLSLSFALSPLLKKYDPHWKIHWLFALTAGFTLLAIVSLAIEDNSTHFGSIPRSEYIRVIGGILNTDPEKIKEHMALQANKKLDNSVLSERGRQRLTVGLQNRKDSFFHLQNNMARKDAEKKEMERVFRQETSNSRRGLGEGGGKRQMTQEERWSQQLEYNENDFTRAFVESNGGNGSFRR